MQALLLGIGSKLFQQVLSHKVVAQLLYAIELVQRCAVLVDVVEGKLANVAVEGGFLVIRGDVACVLGHEDVGRDASSAINRAADACLEGLARLPYAVLREVFASLVSGDELVFVILVVARNVGFLYASARGRVVTGNGEAHHASVLEFHGLLNQSLAKGASSDNRSSVVVLNGACQNLAAAGRAFVYQNDDR